MTSDPSRITFPPNRSPREDRSAALRAGAARGIFPLAPIRRPLPLLAACALLFVITPTAEARIGHDHGTGAPSAAAADDSAAENRPAASAEGAATSNKPGVASTTKGPEGSAHTAAQPAAAPKASAGGTMVSIKSGAGTIQGYLALPKASGPHPGIVVIQEWWGLNDQIKSVADRLAANGYVALAPDLYHGKVTDDPNMALELVRSLPESRGASDLTASYAYLRALPAVGSSPIGSVGFCMGGHFSLLLAMAEPKLAACVVCYGRPESDPAKLKTIGAPILGIYGGQDKGIPQEMVETFRKNLETAGKSVQIRIFPDAGHAFMNPDNPAHKPEDTREAWTLIDAFFAKNLAGK